jgi:Dynamin family
VSNSTDGNRVRQTAPARSATTRVDAPPSITGQGAQVFTARTIGSELEALRRELIACGQELQRAAPFQGHSLFDETLNLLVRLTCRVAVIGQVKAGKSSFINALVGRPELLPTDINPWTTAVTHLHFGCIDAPPNVAAQFTFFDSDEWERLTHGGGRIRELTQRLVPGFEVEQLRKQVDTMRRRSEERLGSALGDLLGTRHAFPSLSPDILEKYVCSGAASLPDGQTEQKGIYADIVRAADLYFASNDFGIPTTIIDTPGTNDPFLVRDEITRRALETADIYIVMLTARQALSSADVALLRILRGLHKDRIAVFVNRIDELGDVLRDTPPILQHVRAGLRREFPTSDIPVVAGSAFWATTAIAGSPGDIDRVFSKKVKAFADHLQSSTQWQPDAGNTREQQLAETLLMCSGFYALSDVLASLALHSHAGHVLKQVGRSFSELGQVGRNAIHQAVAILETEEKSSLSRQQEGEEELRTIDAEVTQNEQLTIALQALLVDLQANMDRAIETHCASMLELLQDEVVRFSEIECDNLQKAIDSGHRGRLWQCETTPLRQQLEEGLVNSYRAAEQEIGRLETQIFPKLQQLLIKHYPQWRRPDQTGRQSGGAELPSLGALSEMVALDLDEPWWKRWWTTSRSTQEQLTELDRLIKQEFYPIVDALVDAARMDLKARQSSALQKSTQIYLGLAEFLQEENRARRARTRILISAEDALRKDQQRVNRRARVADLNRQVPIMELVLRRLENIDRTWGPKLG